VAKHDIDVLFTPYQVITAKTKARNVVMVRNMEPFLGDQYTYGLKGRLRNFLLRRATAASVRSAHRVVAVSDFVADYLEHNFNVGPSRVVCIHHGGDTYFERSESSSPSEEVLNPMFLTCGSLLPYRRSEDIIDAFAIVAKRYPERQPTLIVAGEGTEPRYRVLLECHAHKSGIGKQIQFAGHVSKDRMKELYHRCLACLLATEIEACPNTAIEALMSGCAIIASDTPPLPEILGDAASYYPPRMVELLAEKMGQLIDDPNFASQCREKARIRAACYDWDTCAQQTFELLALG
jgi:glycosyltransferase involved in cell wall biosynthesis